LRIATGVNMAIKILPPGVHLCGECWESGNLSKAKHIVMCKNERSPWFGVSMKRYGIACNWFVEPLF
jgi:hypothetical protein